MKTGVAEVESTARSAPGRVSEPRRAGDVADAPQRVARRLEPDEFRAPRLDRRGERRQILGVDEIDIEAEAPAPRFISQFAQRPVHAARRDDMRAGAEHRNSAIAADMPEPNTSVAAAPSSAPITASASRTVAIVGAAVDVAAPIEVVGVAHEGRREMQRRHDRAASARRSGRAPGRRACAASRRSRRRSQREAAQELRRAASGAARLGDQQVLQRRGAVDER